MDQQHLAEATRIIAEDLTLCVRPVATFTGILYGVKRELFLDAHGTSAADRTIATETQFMVGHLSRHCTISTGSGTSWV